MKILFLGPFLFSLSLSALHNCQAQVVSQREELFSYIACQISANDTSVCIVRDNLRLDDPNKFYSLFLLYGNRIVDSMSFSQDSLSSSGAKPTDLFFWKTASGTNLACVEYDEGSGVGVEISQETELFVFDISKSSLRLLGRFCTDSVYYDARKKEVVEVRSLIRQHADTLHIQRQGWEICLWSSPRKMDKELSLG